MENTLQIVTKRITELVTEDNKDYQLQISVNSLHVKVNTSKNKVGSIIFTTNSRNALKQNYVPLKITNKVSARKIYSNWGMADDLKNTYYLVPNTKYILTIRAFPQYCFVNIEEYRPMKQEIPYSNNDSSSSDSSSDSHSSSN